MGQPVWLTATISEPNVNHESVETLIKLYDACPYWLVVFPSK